MGNAGTEAAFKDNLIALIPHLRAFARSLCRDVTEAEDLAQDTLARAWAAQDSYVPDTNMKAWTFTILRNKFLSEKRRSKVTGAYDPETIEQTLSAVDNPDRRIELEEVKRALGMIPEDLREALILVGASGFSYDEASEVTGVPTGTVKSRVSRARAHLARILADVPGRKLNRDDSSPAERAG